MDNEQSDGNSKVPLVGKVAIFMGLFYSIGHVVLFGFFSSHREDSLTTFMVAWTCFAVCKF